MESKNAHKMLIGNPEAEKHFLACILLDSGYVLNAINGVINEEYFIDWLHRDIFNAIMLLYNDGKHVDIVTVYDDMIKAKSYKFDLLDYLYALTQKEASAYYYKQYYDIVRRDYLLKRIENISIEMREQTHLTLEPQLIINQATQALYEITTTENLGCLEHLSKPMNRFVDEINERSINKGLLRGISTGFPILDKVTHGLQKGDLIILGARPSVGKTSFAINIATNFINCKNEVDNKNVCAIFSLEMSSTQLSQRIVSTCSEISMNSLVTGAMVNAEFERIWNVVAKTNKSRIYIDDSSVQTPGGIFSRCQKLRNQYHQLDLVIIDYLQLMSSNSKSNKNANQNKVYELAEITRNLKVMARDLECPVVVLSQLSRGIENRDSKDRKAKLSDLRDSGAIEQDADIVMFLNKIDEEQKASSEYDILLSIAKHRNGQLMDIKYRWFGDFVCFKEYEDDAG
jgi:replicative DNA helicase